MKKALIALALTLAMSLPVLAAREDEGKINAGFYALMDYFETLGGYPDYYGGAYVMDDYYALVIQTVDATAAELAEMESAAGIPLKFGVVEYSYGELEAAMDELGERWEAIREAGVDLRSAGIDVSANRINVKIGGRLNPDELKSVQELLGGEIYSITDREGEVNAGFYALMDYFEALGGYPDYYGGAYVMDDYYALVIQTVDATAAELAEMESAAGIPLKFGVVEYSYGELEAAMDELGERWEAIREAGVDLRSAGIDVKRNCVDVMVGGFELMTASERCEVRALLGGDGRLDISGRSLDGRYMRGAYAGRVLGSVAEKLASECAETRLVELILPAEYELPTDAAALDRVAERIMEDCRFLVSEADFAKPAQELYRLKVALVRDSLARLV